jgi:hypothetical protein
MSKPNEVNGGVLPSIPTGAIVVIHAPASTDSGWQDYYMTVLNLLKIATDPIDAINTGVEAQGVRITTLEANNSKTRDANRNAAYTIGQIANSLITNIIFVRKSGSPVVKVGYTSGAADIMAQANLSSSVLSAVFTGAVYNDSASTRNIYVTITGGTVDVVRYEKLNVNY